MAITLEQQRFLERYINSKGDFYQVIEGLGLSAYHVLSWQQSNQEFAEEYKNAKQLVIAFLKQENYLLGLSKLNHLLTHGSITITDTHKHKKTPDGDIFEHTSTCKNSGVPIAAIQEALKDSSIQKAITLLANEGILPAHIAKKILESTDKISREIIESFGVEADKDGFISDKKAISLIKAAVLGEVNI